MWFSLSMHCGINEVHATMLCTALRVRCGSFIGEVLVYAAKGIDNAYKAVSSTHTG
jgi:hypothetical protein